MFSARTSWDRTENRLSSALHAARTDGQQLYDLTESNPTRCGIADTEPLIRLLGHPRGVQYAPLPFGHADARAAVVSYYRQRGLPVRAEQVVLTASTSEAYGWLFTLLADREDSVLVPRPSYPLLDWLAATHEVRLDPYSLAGDCGFRLDFTNLARATHERTRAAILVHPNNPTGTFVLRREASELARFAAERGVALIVDEVFGDYRYDEAPTDALPSFADPGFARIASELSPCLTFVLSGLSKVALLPQCKLGWIVVLGPPALVAEALARLELIADTYLSVGTPIQRALPELLQRAPAVLDAARSRIRNNLQTVDRVLAQLGSAFGVRRLPVEGGWYVVLEVPRIYDEEQWTLLLLEQDRVVVHPGYFFDFERDGVLVLSLLPEPQRFETAVERLMRRIQSECGA